MKRTTLATILGLALLAVAALAWVVQHRLASGPIIPAERVVPRVTPQLGVNVALQHRDPALIDSTLQEIAAAGFGWVRQRFPWDEIEPAPGDFRWAPWDELVAATDRNHLTLVAVLDGSPGWARRPEDASNRLAPPGQRADLGRFAAAVATRYGSLLRYYQVWDEPNIAPHWGARPVDAADYAGLLQEASLQIRANDPDAQVLAAALAPNVEPGGANQSDLVFLDALYRAGAAPAFDAIASQPYGFDSPPDESPAPGRLNFNRATLLREIMVRHGDQGKALWAVSYGWYGTLASDDTPSSLWGQVDPALQAQWAVDAAEQARLNWPWLGGLAWAIWQPADGIDSRWGFALASPEGEQGATLKALQQWMGKPMALGPGTWFPTHPALQYEGGWRVTPSAADPPRGAEAGNNRLTIPFDGTGLALEVQRGPYWAYLDVTVDGRPANRLPRDGEARSNLVLYDPLAGVEQVTIADRLADGPHVAEVVAQGGWEQWPLRSLSVWRGSAPFWPTWMPWLLATIGLALVLGSLRGAPRIAGYLWLTILPLVLSTAWASLHRPWWLRYLLLLTLAGAVLLGPTWIQLLALACLLLLISTFNLVGSFLLGAVIPLFLLPVTILGRRFNPAELTAWMVAAGLVIHCLWLLATAIEPNARSRRGIMHALGERWPEMTGLDRAVIALLALSALSLPFAGNHGVAIHEFRTVILTAVLAYGVVRLLPSPLAGDRFSPWPLFWGLCVGAVIVAVWGLYQVVAGVDLIRAEGVVRVRGPYGSPNNLGLYLGHVLPLPLAVALFSRSPARRVAAGLVVLPIIVALVLTFTKGALLLGLPAALLFLGFAAGGRWRWLAVATVVLGGLALLPLFRTERFASLFDLQSGTTFLRLQLWRGAWNMVRDHPWLGVGLDNFLYSYRTTYVVPAAWQELNLSHPHNILLDFWTRLGIGGVLAGGWLFLLALQEARRGLAHAPVVEDGRPLLLGLAASLVATLAHGLIDNSVFLVDLMMLFLISLALIARLSAGSLRAREASQ